MTEDHWTGLPSPRRGRLAVFWSGFSGIFEFNKNYNLLLGFVSHHIWVQPTLNRASLASMAH
jgi:hypothetical protein